MWRWNRVLRLHLYYNVKTRYSAFPWEFSRGRGVEKGEWALLRSGSSMPPTTRWLRALKITPTSLPLCFTGNVNAVLSGRAELSPKNERGNSYLKLIQLKIGVTIGDARGLLVDTSENLQNQQFSEYQLRKPCYWPKRNSEHRQKTSTISEKINLFFKGSIYLNSSIDHLIFYNNWIEFLKFKFPNHKFLKKHCWHLYSAHNMFS